MIDYSKPVTRMGLPVTVLCTNRPGDYPVLVMTKKGNLYFHTADGQSDNCVPALCLKQALTVVQIGIWRHKLNGQYHSSVIYPETKQTCPTVKSHGGKYELVKEIEVEV